MSVSIFASAVRPLLWEKCFKSFHGTSCDFEVIFSGHNTKEEVDPFINEYPFFKYIHTARIKPAQNYQLALSNCTKETVLWFCDDGEVPNDVIGQAYKYWKSQNNEKLILSIQTKESGYGLPKGQLFDMNCHRFFGGNNTTPLMAPLGLMSRAFLNKLGGIDRRYVAGQYENDLVMRAIVEGGSVQIFGDERCFIDIDHLGKSIMIGESTDQNTFLDRPFAKGYEKDREVLERSWTIAKGQMIKKTLAPGIKVYERSDSFEPFEDTDILTKSQSNKGIWI